MACSVQKLREQSNKFLLRVSRKRFRDSDDEETLPFFGIPLNYFSRALSSGGPCRASPALRGGLLPNESRVKPLVWERGEHVTSDQCCYILKRYLGAGSYGMVVKAWNTTDGALVALKFFHRLQHSSKERMEVAILKKLARERLDEFFAVGHDIFRYKSYTVVAMDLLSADLHTVYFQKHLSPRMIRPIAQQIFAALVELGRLGIIHGDLKPMNIMLVNSKSMKVKVIDFSCSTQIKWSKSHQPDMNVQTRFFRAPEIIIGSSCTPQIDMWSLAHTLVVLYSGSVMFRGANSYYMMRYFMKMFGPPEQELIENGKHRTNNFIRGTDGLWRLKKREEMEAMHPTFVHRADPSLPKSVYEIGTTTFSENVDYYWRHGPDLQAAIVDFNGLADLLSKMFVYDPEKRITPKEALNHPFVTMSNIIDTAHTSTSYHNGAKNMMIQTCTAFTRNLHPEWFQQAKSEAQMAVTKIDSDVKKKRDSIEKDVVPKAANDAKKKKRSSGIDSKPEEGANEERNSGTDSTPDEEPKKKKRNTGADSKLEEQPKKKKRNNGTDSKPGEEPKEKSDNRKDATFEGDKENEKFNATDTLPEGDIDEKKEEEEIDEPDVGGSKKLTEEQQDGERRDPGYSTNAEAEEKRHEAAAASTEVVMSMSPKEGENDGKTADTEGNGEEPVCAKKADESSEQN